MVMNAKNFSDATDINYYITNIEHKYVTPERICATDSKRNWVEVFYREAIMMVRAKRISTQSSNQLKKAFYLSILC